jgi:hypothetical protein
MKRVNKYLYLLVIQGNYGQGWEDLCDYEKYKEARADFKEYRISESRYAAHRIIRRRELNPEYQG